MTAKSSHGCGAWTTWGTGSGQRLGRNPKRRILRSGARGFCHIAGPFVGVFLVTPGYLAESPTPFLGRVHLLTYLREAGQSLSDGHCQDLEFPGEVLIGSSNVEMRRRAQPSLCGPSSHGMTTASAGSETFVRRSGYPRVCVLYRFVFSKQIGLGGRAYPQFLKFLTWLQNCEARNNESSPQISHVPLLSRGGDKSSMRYKRKTRKPAPQFRLFLLFRAGETKAPRNPKGKLNAG